MGVLVMVDVGATLLSSVVAVDTVDSFAKCDGTGAGSAHSSTVDSFLRYDGTGAGSAQSSDLVVDAVLHCRLRSEGTTHGSAHNSDASLLWKKLSPSAFLKLAWMRWPSIAGAWIKLCVEIEFSSASVLFASISPMASRNMSDRPLLSLLLSSLFPLLLSL